MSLPAWSGLTPSCHAHPTTNPPLVHFLKKMLHISEGNFRVSQASRVEVKISKFLLEYAGPVPNPEFFYKCSLLVLCIN